MQKELYIKHWVKIKAGKIFDAEETFFETKEKDLNTFLKLGYQKLQISYPKFHKMDGLSKLGVLATQVIAEKSSLPEETALIFSNAASSLETDNEFKNSMQNFPSPATFVYTLPNIVLGELSIKHGLQSENSFFISPQFNAALLADYSSSLIKNQIAPQVLCGWIDLQSGEYDVFLCLISSEGRTLFSEEILTKIYYAENDRPTHRT